MTSNEKKASYAPLWILIALCALPYVVGTLYYQFREELPQIGTSNYGRLVEPARELTGIELILSDGKRTDISHFRKKWLMLFMLDGECAEACQKNIYFMRQIRKATAQDRFRINRLLVLDSRELMTESLSKFLTEFSGMQVATPGDGSKSGFYSTIDTGSGKIFGKIILVDPLGNYIMEYTPDPDPEKLLKDIKQLLKVSRVG